MAISKRHLAAACLISVLSLAAISCKGRHADGTPNGETVEVEVTPVMPDTTIQTEGEYEQSDTIADDITVSDLTETNTSDSDYTRQPRLLQ